MRSKLGYVEGMRGIAALLVCVFHFLVVFSPAIISHDTRALGLLGRLIATSPANILVSGNFAVCLFFVLSGYVLSFRIVGSGDYSPLWKAALKRYPRLMLPTLASLLFAWVILIGNGFFFSNLVQKIGRGLADGYGEPRSFSSVLWQGAFGVFFAGDMRLNGILWTINTELYGSYLVFGFMVLFDRSRWRLLAYVGAAVALYGSYYMAFVLGLTIASIRPNVRPRPLIVTALVVMGLWLGSYPSASAWEGIWLFPCLLFGDRPQIVSHVFGAACLLQAAIMSPAIDLFDHTIFRFLGRISFSLYLIHWTILASLTCWLVLRLEPLLGYLPSIGLAFAVTMPVTLAASYVFTRVIDEPSTRLADRFARWVAALRVVGFNRARRSTSNTDFMY
jgi:peptidoglycan/LPS O-acetylase OafA/YrhL